jgi:hypothetical protein
MEKGWLTKPGMHGPQPEISEKSATTLEDGLSLPQDESLNAQEVNHIQKPEKAIIRSSRTVCSSVYLSSPSELSVNECCVPRAPVAAVPTRRMGISKSNKIIILLVIDSAFFLLELVVGTSFGSSRSTAPTLIRNYRLCSSFTRSRRRLISYGSFFADKHTECLLTRVS